MRETYVIVGAGLGGSTAAMQLRAEGFAGRIVVVGEEVHPPYARPPLSKAIVRGERPPTSAHLRPDKLYARRDIELLLGVRAEALDLERQEVRLSDATVLGYDRLLIASGGRARTLPGTEGIAGVHVLRGLEDAVAINEQLVDGASLTVVGAGFIGAELAASARSMGAQVVMLEGEPHPLARALPPILGQFYLDLHRSHGVDVRVDTGVRAIESDGGRVRALTTDGGAVEADLLVVAVGLVPNTELAEAAGLEVDDGILVDEYCRTSAPDVFAVGDVANHPHPLTGGRGRIEHWQTAQHQALSAARNMLGGTESFREIPWVWSDQYDVRLEIAGRPSSSDAVHLRGDLAARDCTALLVRKGRLVAVVGINRTEDVAAGRKLIAAHATLDPDVLTDERVDLTTMAESAPPARTETR